MEEIMMIEKRQSQRLIGDITTGYRYVDTDTAERIAEAKRRKDENIGMYAEESACLR